MRERLIRFAPILAFLGFCFANQASAGFTDVTGRHPLIGLEQAPRSELDFRLISGVVRGGTPLVIDFDQNRWPDLYIIRYRMEDVLFLNNGGMFTRVENPLGISTSNGGNAGLWADLDNDGDHDFFIVTAMENEYRLYLNEGAAGYREAAVERGVALPSANVHLGTGAAAGDVNLDGYLDILAGEWGAGISGSEQFEHHALFINEGASRPGFFANHTQSAGIVFEGDEINIYSPQIVDLDNDGLPDLPVLADFKKTQMYWNEGDLAFENTTELSGLNRERSGMGTAIGDVNGDGLMDWWTSSILFPDDPPELADLGNQLYINQGGRQFRTITAPGESAQNLAVGGWGWGGDLFDYDNDGDLDVVMTGGPDSAGGAFDPDGAEMGPMRLWRNQGNLTFENVSSAEGVDYRGNGGGLVTLDFDKDGDLDVFVLHLLERPLLLRNDLDSPNRWLRLYLKGGDSNRDGIGARVTVRMAPSGRQQVADYNPTNTFMAQKPPSLHFGFLDNGDQIESIKIRWPNGGIQELTEVALNQELVVEEDSVIPDTIPPEILENPERRILRPGESATLRVRASGKPEPALRWYHNGELIAGETGNELELESVTLQDAGKYWVVASNSAGSAYSAHARISVREDTSDKSVARQWIEECLDAIRLDYPAPTVHSRNLFTLSAAMWDAWVAYSEEGTAVPYLSRERPPIPSLESAKRDARNEAISYAAFRALANRYRLSPNKDTALASFRDRMEALGYDPENLTMTGSSPSAVGNRIAARILAYGWTDGANEKNGYKDPNGYAAVNDPLIFKLPGTQATDPNQWQPLAFDLLILQNGIPVGSAAQEFLGSHWGWVEPFALTRENPDFVYQDPGPPPYLGTDSDLEYKEAAVELIEYGSWLDPRDGERIDVSPNSRHNNPLGTNDGAGYERNPVTDEPYASNLVLRADYGRILAEFWADGPDSETPPGHWNTVANSVSDDPLLEKRFKGEGPLMEVLEWDLKLYFVLNAALSDAAIACWDSKRKYNYSRPITMIRYMGDRGQSSDPLGLAYHEAGLPLKEGLIEVVTEETSRPGQRHAELADHVGEVALYTWKGIPENPNTDIGGVGWIRAVEWMPYQRDTFVTPPFGAYTSGHSTFSRAAAEVLALFTGSEYFPGGISSFSVEKGEFLEFENGPEEDITLTWATYFDAADEAGLSRLYGGIHVRADDFQGRIMGSRIGKEAFALAEENFSGEGVSLNWEEAFDAWADSLVGDPAEYSDAGRYDEDPNGELQRFFFGRPLTQQSAESMVLELSIDPSDRNAIVEFDVPASLVEEQYGIDYTNNLRDWTSIDYRDLAVVEQPAGAGKTRIQILDPNRLPQSGQRYYRIRISRP